MEIRQLTKEDLPQVLVVQRDSYPQPLLEYEGCFARKLALFPDCCLGVFERGELIGYLFTHPWVSGEIVSLNAGLTTVPHTTDCIYIHDLAVLRSRRGHGIAHVLLWQIFQIAGSRDVNTFALVAVNRSEPFWERYGFRRHSTLIYGEGITATYMVRTPGTVEGSAYQGIAYRRERRSTGTRHGSPVIGCLSTTGSDGRQLTVPGDDDRDTSASSGIRLDDPGPLP